jgi:malonyl-CoA/methylmalonyl-CoA synthetase
MRSWAKEKLAAYKVPQNLMIIDQLPKNAMGKVLKPAVKQLFQ